MQVLYAHLWGLVFLGERETWSGVTGSLLLACGVITVSTSKAKALEPGPDDTTAFVTSIESKAPDFEDTRITLGDHHDRGVAEWRVPLSEASEVEMTLKEKSQSWSALTNGKEPLETGGVV